MPLASPLVTELGTGTAAAKPLLRKPYNARSYGPPRISSRSTRVPSPRLFGSTLDSGMEAVVSGVARLPPPHLRQLSGYLVNNGGPHPVTLGEAA